MQITAYKNPKYDYDALVYIENGSIISIDSNNKKIASGTAGIDDGTVISAAQAYGKTFIAPGTYYYHTRWLLKSGEIYGVRNKTFIQIADDCTIPAQWGAITNEHIAGTYNTATADSIYIHDLTIIHGDTGATIANTMQLYNIKKFVCERVDFLIPGKESTNALYNLTLEAACRDVTIRDCKFTNMQERSAGGNIQVRANCGSPSDIENATQDVLIENCEFLQTSIDESIDISGILGKVRNIIVRDCILRFPSGGAVNTGSGITIQSGSINGTNPYASVDSVYIIDNTIYADNINNYVAKVGWSGEADTEIRDVIFESNRLICNIPTSGTNTIGLYNINGINIRATKNFIISDASGNGLSTGISGFDYATDNIILGYIVSYALHNCNVVSGNIVNLGDVAVICAHDCKLIDGNTFSSRYPIIIETAGSYVIQGNDLTVPSGSALSYGIEMVNTTHGKIINNNINILRARVAFRFAGAGIRSVSNNIINGTSIYYYEDEGTTPAYFYNNNWFTNRKFDNNRGSATITAGNTYIDITHNLIVTPSLQNIHLIPNDNLGGRTFWVDTIGATTFRVNISSADVTNHVFGWQVV